MLQYDGDLNIPNKFLVNPPEIKDTLTELLVKAFLSLESEEECRNFFAPGGILSSLAAINGRPCEERPQQLAMALAIADALKKGENLCVEAPTGIGKSFAYLIPLIYRSQICRRPALITTETINLQQQLIEKDIRPRDIMTEAAFHNAETVDMALGDVPIGLVGAYVGATCIETWIPGPTEETYTTKKRIKQPNQQPSRLYNGKVAPIVPYAIKGVIWYQGESNNSVEGLTTYAPQLQEYYDKMAGVFRNPSLKLYFAQLAPWGSPNVPAMQIEQQRFAEAEKNAGMAVICDTGNLHDIHPNEKQTVALRLALLALKRDYGFKNIIADSPTLVSWKVEDGKFKMKFKDVKKWSLYDPDWSYHRDPKKTELMGFEVAGEDGVWHPAEIGNLQKLNAKHVEYRGQIEGEELVVYSDKVAAPKALRYLHSRPWYGRLHNEAGLPLGAFRIDVK